MSFPQIGGKSAVHAVRERVIAANQKASIGRKVNLTIHLSETILTYVIGTRGNTAFTFISSTSGCDHSAYVTASGPDIRHQLIHPTDRVDRTIPHRFTDEIKSQTTPLGVERRALLLFTRLLA